MADLTIEDVPDELRREFQRLPDNERRKLEAQVVSYLRDGLLQRRAQIGGSKLERVRAFVNGHDGGLLTPELVEEAISTGRT